MEVVFLQKTEKIGGFRDGLISPTDHFPAFKMAIPIMQFSEITLENAVFLDYHRRRRIEEISPYSPLRGAESQKLHRIVSSVAHYV
jgi:hypothetical protein